MKKFILILLFFNLLFSLSTQDKDLIFYNRKFTIDNVTNLDINNNYFNLTEMGESLVKGVIETTKKSGYTILNIKENNKKSNFILFNLPYTLILINMETGKFYKCTDYSKGGLSISMESHLWEAKEIKSNSNLIEKIKDKTMNYSASNLQNFFEMKPWVENEKGDGVGVKLFVKFYFKTNNIVLLNGFIDPKNLELYYLNNRIKKIKVECKSQKFSNIYEIKDLINLQQINFPIESDEFEITIEDIYKGTKFNDTCLTGLLTNYFGIWKNIQ